MAVTILGPRHSAMSPLAAHRALCQEEGWSGRGVEGGEWLCLGGRVRSLHYTYFLKFFRSGYNLSISDAILVGKLYLAIAILVDFDDVTQRTLCDTLR